MKQLFKLFSIFILSTTSCHAQKMVQKISDAKKLEINEKKFIGKPLKVLLKEIKPQIEMAIARSDNPAQASFFNFYFTPQKKYNEYRKQNKFPLTIKVYIKGTFNWNRKDRTKEDWLKWTKEDEEEYGNLIIEGIKIYGEN